MDLKVTATLRTEDKSYTQPIKPSDNIKKWNKCSDKILGAKSFIVRREGVK